MAKIDKVYAGLESHRNRYVQALLATWREASGGVKSPALVPFEKEDIVRHGREVMARLPGDEAGAALQVKNIPDIIYTFRARADLPTEIADQGHYAIIGRGKGKYAFAKLPGPNRLSPPKDVVRVELANAVPTWVRGHMSNDEQSVLTAVFHNELIKKHLGLKDAFRLQSHLRMGVRGYGQVEVDEVYVGRTAEGAEIGIAVEAKDYSPSDCLNVAQLFGTSKALPQLFPKIARKLIGVKPTQTGEIYLVEFSVPDEVQDLKVAGAWKQYVLK